MRNTKLASLSMICVAGGAFSSTAGQHPEINNLNYASNAETSKHNNIVSKISKSTDLSGVKFAKSQSLTGLIGSTNNSENGASSVSDGCYSNCYAQPIASCHTESVADQCAELGFSTTTCSSGYALSNQCTVSGGTLYYSTCTCHSDNCPDLLTTANNARASFVSAVSGSTATSTAYTQAFSTASGIFTNSATANFSSDTARTTANSAYSSYVSAANNYSSSCSTYSNAYSCYSNCHTETVDCPSYLASQSVSSVTTAAELTSALSSSNSTIALLADVSTTSVSLGTKKLVGPKYFTSSSVCTALSTPTLTLSGDPAISMSSSTSNGLEYLNISMTGNPIQAGTVSGSLSNLSVAFSADSGLVTAGSIKITGPVTINNTAGSYGFPALSVTSGKTAAVSDNLTITGGILDVAGTFNLASGKTVRLSGTKGEIYITGDFGAAGNIIIEDAEYGIEIGTGGILALNGSGSSITASKTPFFITGGELDVYASTSVTITGSPKYVFYFGTAYDGTAIVSSTLTANGTTVPTGEYGTNYSM